MTAENIHDTLVRVIKEGKNEGAKSPYWLILDPCQNMRCDVYNLASQITGPFFSREDAKTHLKNRRYAFSERAVVFCLSGHWSSKYRDYYRSIEEEQR
jgi:hypothetical protein